MLCGGMQADSLQHKEMGEGLYGLEKAIARGYMSAFCVCVKLFRSDLIGCLLFKRQIFTVVTI